MSVLEWLGIKTEIKKESTQEEEEVTTILLNDSEIYKSTKGIHVNLT